MAKTNYNYEKRQRELAKKKKQDEKRLRKQNKVGAAPDSRETDGAPAGTSGKDENDS